jgi:putative flippase GtrA
MRHGEREVRRVRPSSFVALYPSREFIRFLVFGGLAAAIALAVGWELYGPGSRLPMPYWAAVGIAASLGAAVNFTLNYSFNFRFRGRSALGQLRTFIAVSLGGVGLASLISDAALHLLLWAGCPVLALPGGRGVPAVFAAHVVATGLVTFYSFAAHRALTFNHGIRSRLRQAFAAGRD